jgi:hypothetical protein
MHFGSPFRVTFRFPDLMGASMKPVKRVIYETPKQFEALIKQREVVAELLPNGTIRQTALKEIALLRSYAQMQRLLALPN